MKNPREFLEMVISGSIRKTRGLLTNLLKFRSGIAGRLVLPVTIFLPIALLVSAALVLLSSSHIKKEIPVTIHDTENLEEPGTYRFDISLAVNDYDMLKVDEKIALVFYDETEKRQSLKGLLVKIHPEDKVPSSTSIKMTTDILLCGNPGDPLQFPDTALLVLESRSLLELCIKKKDNQK